jgi:hypothetical protein
MSQASEHEVSTPLPVRHIAEINTIPLQAKWLIEPLWCAEGVGIVGGQPRSFKTWLAAELALAVASGERALGRFATKVSGPVLVFAAEDPPANMKARFEAIASVRNIDLKTIPLYLLDVATLRIDDNKQLHQLRQAVASLKPKLLILDPFVRIARVDENSATEVSNVLGSLRAIQRDLGLAILLVHHMRKSPSPRLGQQLRGSSDFAAWSDSALYLTSRNDRIMLSVEHRHAPAPPPFQICLAREIAPHLQVKESPVLLGRSPLEDAVLDRLKTAIEPLPTTQLRLFLRIRKAALLEALRALRERGLVQRSDDGWLLPQNVQPP